MGKIAGKFITLFLLCMSSIAQASGQSIVLSIHDMDDKPVQQVMVQSQFILQVSLNNFDAAQDFNSVPGMDAFQYAFLNRQSNISIYNGKRMSKNIYKFVMRADKKGVYKVGPLQVEDMTMRKIESNVVSITVGDEIILSDQNNQTDAHIIFARLDNPSIYVGEKNRLYVDFLSRSAGGQCELQLPQFENIITTHVEKKQEAHFKHSNGQEYARTQWIVDFYPKNKGFTVIEDVRVRFLNQHFNHNPFGAFFGNFGMYAEQELRARPIGLQVLELPKVEGFQDVTAVGQFSKLALSVNKNSALQGQGIILTVDIHGDGNFEMIDPLSLILPEGFTCYDSDNPKIDEHRTYKHFEYVLQAQAPGEYHIPAQKFNYFDPVDHQYKTLQCNAFDILIIKDPLAQQHNDQLQQSLLDESRQHDTKTIMDYTVLEQKVMPAGLSTMIPIPSYTWLLQLLCLIFLLMMIYRYGIKKYVVTHEKFQHFIIFFKAKRACQIAEKNHNVVALHPLFIDLFVHLKVGSLGLIRDEMIEQYLRDKNFSDELIMQWKIFYNKLLQASFAQSDKQNDMYLFQEALRWLARLQEKI